MCMSFAEGPGLVQVHARECLLQATYLHIHLTYQEATIEHYMLLTNATKQKRRWLMFTAWMTAVLKMALVLASSIA